MQVSIKFYVGIVLVLVATEDSHEQTTTKLVSAKKFKTNELEAGNPLSNAQNKERSLSVTSDENVIPIFAANVPSFDKISRESKTQRKKKSATTTFCVEIRPSSPYQRPFQVCEPDYKPPVAYGEPASYSSASTYGDYSAHKPSYSNPTGNEYASAQSSYSSASSSYPASKSSYTSPVAPSYTSTKSTYSPSAYTSSKSTSSYSSSSPSYTPSVAPSYSGSSQQSSTYSAAVPTTASASYSSSSDHSSASGYDQTESSYSTSSASHSAAYRSGQNLQEELEFASGQQFTGKEDKDEEDVHMRSAGYDDDDDYGSEYGISAGYGGVGYGGGGGYSGYGPVTYITHVKPKKHKGLNLFKKDKKEYAHNGLVITCQPSLAGYATSVANYGGGGYGVGYGGGGYGRSYSAPSVSHSKYNPPSEYTSSYSAPKVGYVASSASYSPSATYGGSSYSAGTSPYEGESSYNGKHGGPSHKIPASSYSEESLYHVPKAGYSAPMNVYSAQDLSYGGSSHNTHSYSNSAPTYNIPYAAPSLTYDESLYTKPVSSSASYSASVPSSSTTSYSAPIFSYGDPSYSGPVLHANTPYSSSVPHSPSSNKKPSSPYNGLSYNTPASYAESAFKSQPLYGGLSPSYGELSYSKPQPSYSGSSYKAPALTTSTSHGAPAYTGSTTYGGSSYSAPLLSYTTTPYSASANKGPSAYSELHYSALAPSHATAPSYSRPSYNSPSTQYGGSSYSTPASYGGPSYGKQVTYGELAPIKTTSYGGSSYNSPASTYSESFYGHFNEPSYGAQAPSYASPTSTYSSTYNVPVATYAGSSYSGSSYNKEVPSSYSASFSKHNAPAYSAIAPTHYGTPESYRTAEDHSEGTAKAPLRTLTKTTVESPTNPSKFSGTQEQESKIENMGQIAKARMTVPKDKEQATIAAKTQGAVFKHIDNDNKNIDSHRKINFKQVLLGNSQEKHTKQGSENVSLLKAHDSNKNEENGSSKQHTKTIFGNSWDHKLAEKEHLLEKPVGSSKSESSSNWKPEMLSRNKELLRNPLEMSKIAISGEWKPERSQRISGNEQLHESLDASKITSNAGWKPDIKSGEITSDRMVVVSPGSSKTLSGHGWNKQTAAIAQKNEQMEDNHQKTSKDVWKQGTASETLKSKAIVGSPPESLDASSSKGWNQEMLVKSLSNEQMMGNPQSIKNWEVNHHSEKNEDHKKETGKSPEAFSGKRGMEWSSEHARTLEEEHSFNPNVALSGGWNPDKTARIPVLNGKMLGTAPSFSKTATSEGWNQNVFERNMAEESVITPSEGWHRQTM